MKTTIINNHNDLLDLLSANEKVYCLIFKPDSEISSCASTKLFDAAKTSQDGVLATVDVSKVRDVHTEYAVTSAPTLLVFKKGKQVNQVKGCNDIKFYENLLKGAYFVSKDGKEKPAKSVTVYTTPTCTYCNSVKSYLRKLQIVFREVDISKDQKQAETLVKRTGQQGVPQTDINGTFVVGFDTMKLNRLLEIQN
ncbi:MAG: thioredoxin family protein [Bacteroidota bacterium]|nr:thioredoxin family protein [Bacteroidota bacterium]